MSRPAPRHSSCMARSCVIAASLSRMGMIQFIPVSAASILPLGPRALKWNEIGSVVLISSRSGLRNRILRRLPSNSHSVISSLSRARTLRTYSRMSFSLTAPSPMVRRAVNPVATPKSIRPGASLLSEARALAVTGAIRLDGIKTPVPSRIRSVCTAAAAMTTNRSAFRS